MCAGGEDLLILKAHLMRVCVCGGPEWPTTNPILFVSILVQNGKSVLFAHAKSSDWRTFIHSFNEKQQLYSGPSLIRIAWDQSPFRLVKFSD